MTPKFPHLMSPLVIRGKVLKNRMIATNSLPHFLQGPESYPADSVMAHYENKAKSAAVVTCMGINNFSRGKQLPMFLDFGHFPDYDLYDTNSQNYLLQLADAIHYYDSIACMGLFVGPPSCYPLMVPKGQQGPAMSAFDEAKDGISAPPPVEFDLEKIPAHEDCTYYTDEQFEKIAKSYAEQSSILQMLDFDMVSVHMCYRANLPARMFSPVTNHRTDKWGGSLENRMRFPLLVLKTMREKLGPRTLIEIQWSFDDVEGGYTMDDTIAFLNEAKKYIDLVQLRYHEVDHAHPINICEEEVPFLDACAKVKAAVPDLMMGVVGGWHYPATAEKALAEGKCDVIYAARAYITNPDYGQLIKEGRDDDIVPCLRCNKCHGRGEHDPFVSVCSVNPVIGLEHKIDRMQVDTKKGKKVAIIGGGPAAMRCALYLKQRGHHPVIYEKGPKLGGAIIHSDYVSFKWTLKDFKDWLIYQLNKQGVEVHLNTEATPEMIASMNYDVVVAATGATPLMLPIPGASKDTVTFCQEAFANPDALGRNVVIIGGGEVGCEMGIFLSRKGHSATVLEMRDRLAADSTAIHYYSMLEEAWNAEPNFHGITGAKVAAIVDGAVEYTDKDGNTVSVPADSVIMSAGMRANQAQAMAFLNTAPEFYMIGDCKRPATIQQAMRSAYSTAMRI